MKKHFNFKKFRILFIFGTRPECVKMAPVVEAFQRDIEHFQTIICVTAQHRQMLDQALSLFKIKPDIDLNLMEENQRLDSLTANAIQMLTKTIIEVKPDLVLVQGDTTTAMVGALASFYQRIPVGHIEAGLRTKDRYNPFPEEINRHLISVLTTYHFAPTQRAVEALLREGISEENIFLTGNTVVDALHMIAKEGNEIDIDPSLLNGNKLILVTAHRRENFGEPLKNICMALKEIVRRNSDVEIVYPVHMNPNVKGPVYNILRNQDRIHLTQPLEYVEFVNLLNSSYLVLTDSGGIQEEAPAFGKPILVLRKETERPEGVEVGIARLVGTDVEKIIRSTELLLHNHKEYAKMSKTINPYGDGLAAGRIYRIVLATAKNIKRIES